MVNKIALTHQDRGRIEMRKDVDNYLHSAFTKEKLVLSTQIKGRQRSTSVC